MAALLCIDSTVQLESQIFAGVKSASLSDENPGEVGIDAPVANLVGVSKCVAGNLAAKAHVIEPTAHRSKAGLDIAETLAIRQLSKGHTEELVVAREALDLVVAVVASNASSKIVKGKEVHDLGKDGRRGVHRSLLAVVRQKGDDNTKPRSNRLRPKSPATYVI
jgi:hypothetical protein